MLDSKLLPTERNPARGWTATANQNNVPPDYPHLLGLEWANSSTSLIYITAVYAAALEDEQQHRLLAQLYPPVVVIQDIRSNTPVQDLAKQLRAQLGVLE